MAQLEIFQNGTSLRPDRMGEPVFQIGTKNADGEYDVVVFDAMTESQARAKLAEMQPSKPKPKPASEPKEKAPKKKVSTKDAAKTKAKKPAKKKKIAAKKKKRR